MPFAVMGTVLFMAAIFTAVVLPSHSEPGEDRETGPSIFKVLKIPGVLLATFSIVVTSMSIGFLQATLEPHLRQFNLSPVVLGLMFIINGGTYAITAPGFGWFCDKVCAPKVITVIGACFVCAGFSLVGPAPFIPCETMLWVTILGLILHGLGMAAQLVASFTDALRTSVAYGFHNNLETFALISALWTSSFALGAFIGPSISGILYDNVGFRNGSMFIFALHAFLAVFVTVYLFCNKPLPAYAELKDEKIPNGDVSTTVNKLSYSGLTESAKSIRSVGNGISIEKSRPAGMNSLIACNSYKSQAWPKRDVDAGLRLGKYSHSYGSVMSNRNGYLEGMA
ncbi:MFS-type transporter SLC18B1-like isoform X2 [Agrilus planipennis]|nr:MFS-type transporter SLC18B1-like isoform X2 [Agrilus planipennis]